MPEIRLYQRMKYAGDLLAALQHKEGWSIEKACAFLESIPDADFVRCKNCKHWHEAQGWCDKHSHFVDSDGQPCHVWEGQEWTMFEPNDFCSLGERKETT